MPATPTSIEVLQRFYAALRDDDAGALAGLHTDDFQLVVSGDSAISGTYQGQQEAAHHAEHVRDLTAGQLHLHLERLLADDETGIALLTARARRPDGRQLSQRILHECQLRHGKLSELREWIWDQHTDREFWA